MVTPYRPEALPTKEDEDHLRLLSVLFYAYAAFAGLVGLCIAGFGLLPALVIAAAPTHGSDAPPLLVGGILFAIFGAIAGVLMLKSVLMVLAGRALSRRRGYVLVLVAACLAIPNVPLGTALGIFAIIVLQRPAVKALFGA